MLGCLNHEYELFLLPPNKPSKSKLNCNPYSSLTRGCVVCVYITYYINFVTVGSCGLITLLPVTMFLIGSFIDRLYSFSFEISIGNYV